MSLMLAEGGVNATNPLYDRDFMAISFLYVLSCIAPARKVHLRLYDGDAQGHRSLVADGGLGTTQVESNPEVLYVFNGNASVCTTRPCSHPFSYWLSTLIARGLVCKEKQRDKLGGSISKSLHAAT